MGWTAGWAAGRRPWVLICAGINLMLAQYWMTREYQLILASSELSVLLTVLTFFASCSLGYLLSPPKLGRFLPWLGLLLFVLHLCLPWLMKEVAALYVALGLPGMTVVLLGIGLFLVAPLYTTLLPAFITATESDGRMTGEALRWCYGLELGGAIAGIGLILVLGRFGMGPLLVLYFIAFSVILAFLFDDRRVLVLTLPLALLYGALYPLLEAASTTDFYRSRAAAPALRLLATAQSPYSRIDVVEPRPGEKSLLLNGREYFNPTFLEAFNRYLAGIPSDLMPGSKVLIVGTGSLSSVYHAARSARSVESVEIDAQVVALTRELFRDYNHLDAVDHWSLHIDDAKHFLGSTTERYDLIVIDMVPPVYVQTAWLFSSDFYALVRQRLAPGGVLSIYTGDWFGEAALRKLRYSPIKTVDSVFQDYLVVNSRAARMAFVYASDHLPFGKQALRDLLGGSSGNDADEVFEAAEVRPRIAHLRPSSAQDLGIVLEWAPEPYGSPMTRLARRPPP
jgi:spermidine synthase